MFRRSELLSKLDKYNFIEVSQARLFIEFFYFGNDVDAEELYILCKVVKCLSLHDNGDDYFHDMRDLVAKMKKKLVPYVFLG